jgi:uncharacterized repeat protein (TIGR01451 family)
MSAFLKSRTVISALAVSVMAFALPASALTATQIVEKEVITQNPDGTTQTQRVSAESVIPGERIVYTLRYLNDGTEPATNLVMTMPVPKEVTFIDGSANRSGAETVYSVDGGNTFASRENLVVRGTNGASRPAKAEDITHVKWTVVGPVQSAEAGELVFKGVLK